MSEKTLAMKVLDGKGMAYEVYSFPSTERDAEKIAELMGIPAEQVFKTLVAIPNTLKPVLVMIPADCELDLNKFAKGLGQKKVRMASHSEAERLTGLQVGGISALALINKGFKVYLDESARNHDKVFVSAGQRGLDLEIKTADLVKVTRARQLQVARTPKSTGTTQR